MPGLTGSFAGLTLDFRAAKIGLEKELKDILKDGTRAWLITVRSIVPVWSGASLAQFQELAEKVDLSWPISPVAPIDRRGLGRASADVEYHDAGPVFFFRWSTSLFYFIYNEYNDANKVGFHLRNPGPYHSQARAANAFKFTVEQRLSRLRFDVRKYIKPHLIQVDK